MIHDDTHTDARTHRQGIDTDGPGPALSRRSLLGAAGGALATGLAGCSVLTQQSFEASPVVLPAGARDELVLAELAREAPTLEFDDPRGDGQVRITNQVAIYDRGQARGTPTVLESFTGMVNGTPGSGSNINAVGSEIGVDEAALGFFEETPTVDGDNVSVVLPAGARTADGSVMHGKLMALIPGSTLERGPLDYDGEERGAFFPGLVYYPGSAPAYLGWPDERSEFRVFTPNAESLLDRIGMDGLPEGAEWADPGVPIEPAETVFASTVADFENPHELSPASEVYDPGEPFPLGGSPFGLGALATPSASVGGQTLNPLVGLETGELLRRESIGRILSETGVSDAPDLPWLAGPEAFDEDGWFTAGDAGRIELLGEETDVETFVGVVEGEDGPFAMALNVARVTPDDHVFAVVSRWRPVGTVDGGMGIFDSGWWSPAEPGDGLSSTNTLVADALASLEQR